MLKKLRPSLDYLRPVAVDDLVRVGKSADGGYLLPRSRLGDVDAVLSFGLATDWSFEEQLARLRPGIPIHVYDHTVGAKSFYRAAKSRSWKFLGGGTSFTDVRMRWKTYTGYRRFFSGRHCHYAERVFNRRDDQNDATLEVAFGRLSDAHHVLLKVDIEGSEYRIVPAIGGFAERIDLLAIEFHDTDPLRPVFEAQIRSLLEHFAIVHLHANNITGVAEDGLPDAVEITFVNKRHRLPEQRRERLPLAGLDQPNDPGRPDYEFVFT
jgi:hypothetical protein